MPRLTVSWLPISSVLANRSAPRRTVASWRGMLSQQSRSRGRGSGVPPMIPEPKSLTPDPCPPTPDSSTQPPRRVRFWRRPRFWVSLAIGLVLLTLAAPYLAALYWWRAGGQALARHQAREAASHLQHYLRVWPSSAAAHLRAARAARLLEDYEAAERHLLECQRLEDRPSDDSL